MTLHATFDQGRYTVSDGVHSAADLSRDEYLLLRADFESGQHPARELFAQAAQRHLTVTR